MTTELNDFAAAAALAMAEHSEATESDAETSLPEVEAQALVEDGQAAEEEVEQTDSQDTEAGAEGSHEEPEGDESDEDESLFGDIEIEDADNESPAIPDDATFELPGVEGSVTLQELKDGYLRQADYTRKTQEVAETKKANEKAVSFYEALQGNPEAVVRQLAEQVGLIESGAQPVKAVEFSPLRTAEDVEAEIAKRVEDAVKEHPAVQEAEHQKALATINAEFDRIGQENDVVISDADRKVVLQEAQRRGVADLELVFHDLMRRREAKTREREALKSAAPARPTGAPSSEANNAPAASFQEAAQRALMELGHTN